MSTVAKLTREEITNLVTIVASAEMARKHSKESAEAEQKLIEAGLLDAEGNCMYGAEGSDFELVHDLFEALCA